jgi:glucosamine-6-phosphate deaminase
MQTRQYDELQVLIGDNDGEIGTAAAEVFASAVSDALKERGEISVILALGASQPTFFSALRERTDIAWSRINVLHVDTYMGVAESAPESGASRMRKHLLDEVKPKAFYPIQGDHLPVEEELTRYGRLFNELDPVLTVVGIGESGHLAFNDPPADFRTRDIIQAVPLSDVTRTQIVRNRIFPDLDKAPRYGLSLTMYALLRQPTVIALVHEPEKAEAVRQLLEEPISIMRPASILKTKKGARLYLGPAAATLLQAPANP